MDPGLLGGKARSMPVLGTGGVDADARDGGIVPEGTNGEYVGELGGCRTSVPRLVPLSLDSSAFDRRSKGSSDDALGSSVPDDAGIIPSERTRPT